MFYFCLNGLLNLPSKEWSRSHRLFWRIFRLPWNWREWVWMSKHGWLLYQTTMRWEVCTQRRRRFWRKCGPIIICYKGWTWDKDPRKVELETKIQEVEAKIPEDQDLSNYATKDELPDLSPYALKTELPNVSTLTTKEEFNTKIQEIEASIPEDQDLSNYLEKQGLEWEIDDMHCMLRFNGLSRENGNRIFLQDYTHPDVRTQGWYISSNEGYLFFLLNNTSSPDIEIVRTSECFNSDNQGRV